MQKQEIRDRGNRLLGTIYTLANGKLEIRDPSNRPLGQYDPRKNETRDRSNRFVSTGNTLTTLLGR